MSAQAAEITACILALQMFSNEPINLYTDSIYLSQIIAALETAPYISPVSHIQQQLCCLQHLFWSKCVPHFVSHIRGHTQFPGPLAEHNQLADANTQILFAILEEKATKLHDKYHLNACSLQHHTGCSKVTALKITTQCSTCFPFHNAPIARVHPCSLKPNDIWQMDVTHLHTVGKL